MASHGCFPYLPADDRRRLAGAHVVQVQALPDSLGSAAEVLHQRLGHGLGVRRDGLRLSVAGKGGYCRRMMVEAVVAAGRERVDGSLRGHKYRGWTDRRSTW